MAGMEILYLGITGVAVYLAWQTGLLDQAGNAIVQATTPKQGYAKHRHHRKEILIEPVVYPPVPLIVKPKRLRLTGIT